MTDRNFRGRYPGGPSRGAADDAQPRDSGRRIDSVGDIEERAQATAHRRRKARRSRRVPIGFLVILATAGAIGLWLGFGSHATPEEMAEELNREAAPDALSDEEYLRRELLRLQSQPSQTPGRGSGDGGQPQ